MRDRIRQMRFPFRGFILNRSLAGGSEPLSPESLTLPASAIEAGLNADDLHALAEVERWQARQDREHLDLLRREAGDGAFALAAPHLGSAIEDLAGLDQLAQGLIAARVA